jgi:hypothetical protein
MEVREGVKTPSYSNVVANETTRNQKKVVAL